MLYMLIPITSLLWNVLVENERVTLLQGSVNVYNEHIDTDAEGRHVYVSVFVYNDGFPKWDTVIIQYWSDLV